MIPTHLVRVTLIIALIAAAESSFFAQDAGSISGSVTDAGGALVRNASVTAKGAGGQEYTAFTGEKGYFVIPSVPSGIYTLSASATGFKKTVATGIKVDVGTPARADLKLEAGEVSEIVEVRANEEPLQSETATISSTITASQIEDVPSLNRNALDVVSLTPGVATVGKLRSSSVNGLPKTAISIAADGADIQDNSNKSWDGFYTFVSPRTDAVEEVTVTTAVPDAATNSDGPVRIRFVTKRGTNNYRGRLFWQHRNTALNSNYWYNNRDFPPDPSTGKAPRSKILLNQFGGSLGGPLPFLNPGNGGPFFHSGKDKAFFFVNYEQLRFPFSFARTRTVLTPEASMGVFRYLTGGNTQTIDLFAIAAENNQLATVDPTIGALLERINRAASASGVFSPAPNAPNKNLVNFMTSARDVRKYLTLRFDFNLTPDENIEVVTNRQTLEPTVAYQYGGDPSFPGFPGFGFSWNPESFAVALRSAFSSSFANEVRYTFSGGSYFVGTITAADYAETRGFNLYLGTAGINTPFPNPSGYLGAWNPTYEVRDSATWIRGSHTLGFGGQFKYLRTFETQANQIVPQVGFEVDSSEGTAYAMFNEATMPGSTLNQRDEARKLYAVLVGRVAIYNSFAYLNEQGRYVENGPLSRELSLKTYGLFVQDRWRISRSLAVTLGIRWQPQEGFVVKTGNAGKLIDPNMVWGISGPGNAFKPGILEGSVPLGDLYKPGEKIYPDDLKNFAPTAGIVWGPDLKGLAGRMLGRSGDSVLRAGYALSYLREGAVQQLTPIRNGPGGGIEVSRWPPYGNFIFGTNLRDPNNPNLMAAPFSPEPDIPFVPNVAVAVDPNIKTGYVHTFSAGYQRRIGNNSVVEIRYVGNRGRRIRRTNFLNEPNTIENGFSDEFLLAQANLYANIAAGRGATFAYFGAGTGTSPLPTMLAYFNPPATYDPSNPAVYNPGNFSNFTLVRALSMDAADIQGFINTGAFEINFPRRANAVANGLPPNFFRVNPDVRLLSNQLSDDASSWYDALAVEFRRRLSSGLRVQASYVYSKAMSNAFSSNENQRSDHTLRPGGLDLARNFSPFDIRHQFKFDASYELPIGRGREYFSGAGRTADLLLGGWSVIPVVRWQSGSPFSLGNVQLVGMTAKELQKEIKVRKGPNSVTFLPDDIILNTHRAYDISVTSPTGYGTTYGGPPEGRFIAPAGYGSCISHYPGECGFANLILHGPGFFKFDAAILKSFRIDDKRSIDLRFTAFDVLNRPSFRIGGWDSDVTGSFVGGSSFGQLFSGSAYQDLADSQYPGGRVIDILLRLNF